MLLVEDNLSYHDAKANCAQMNSTLVEFWDEEEWDKVRMLHWQLRLVKYAPCLYDFQITSWVDERHSSRMYYWIGLNDLENEGSFMWESGRDLSEEVKVHWADDQPNNQDGTDHCVQVFRSHSSDRGEMWDTVCERNVPSVCQKRSPGKELT